MSDFKKPSRSERKKQAEELEAKWLSRADQIRVKHGKKPARKTQKSAPTGYIKIVPGGKVSPR